MSRALLRSVLELRAPVTRLLPLRPAAAAPAAPAAAAAATVRFFNQTAQFVETDHVDPAVMANGQPQPTSASPLSSSAPQPTSPSSGTQASPPPPAPPTAAAQQPPSATRKPFSESVRALLPVLAAQPGHYIRVHIHGRPFLVTEGDAVRLPFRIPGVAPGDVLRLDRASVLGSRDLTLRGAPWVDERLFECRAVVTGTESEPLRVKVKKKRRCRRAKHVKSKHRYTMLRICELRVRADAVREG